MNCKGKKTKEQKREKKNKRRRKPFRFFIFDFVKVTGAITALLWLRPKRLFENKKARKPVWGGAMAIANHTNVRDAIALYIALWYRRVHVVAMQEMFHTKWGNGFFRGALCIPVDRKNFNMQTFHSVSEVLEEGGVVGIFPEGQINSSGDAPLQAFKSGAVLMAIKARVPIVPVYIAPFGKWYKRSVIVVGEPIDVQALCGDKPSLRALDEVSQKLREKEIALMEIYQKWKKK